MHVSHPYHPTLFSPDASDTCSSWNLSPYPPLLDMTKPSTPLQPNCNITGSGHSPSPFGQTQNRRNGFKPSLSRYPERSKLRNRVPHVSHFSVSQVSRRSKAPGHTGMSPAVIGSRPLTAAGKAKHVSAQDHNPGILSATMIGDQQSRQARNIGVPKAHLTPTFVTVCQYPVEQASECHETCQRPAYPWTFAVMCFPFLQVAQHVACVPLNHKDPAVQILLICPTYHMNSRTAVQP